MLFENIAIIDENFDYQPNCTVGVESAHIALIAQRPLAPEEREQAKARFGEAYDGHNKLLIPAMYNAHAHAAMTLLRGYAENAPLQVWLNDLVWPFEAHITPEDNYWGTLLACLEMARYGIVSHSDMYFALPERAQATIDAGMKANLCEGFTAFEDKPYGDYDMARLNEEFFAKYHGADEGRILVDFNIHGEYTSHPQVCAGVAEAAKRDNVRIQIHASETQSEHEECKQRHDGMTPMRYFESLGVLDVPVTAAHCVWVEPEDIEIMVKHNVFVAANPASNLKLGSGIAPIPAMLEAGVNVCLGTDGMASNNNHDMFKETYLLATLSKGYYHDPTAVSPKQALYAATRAGALSQGRDDCGLIKEGFKADLAVVSMENPSWTPVVNPLNNLVFSGHGSDVVLTMCDGRVIYRNGAWGGAWGGVDVERAKAEVQARTERILASL